MNLPGEGVDPGREALELVIETRPAGDTRLALLQASGEIDLANAEELAAALRTADAVDADAIVFDFTYVPFVDSSGLQVLLLAAREFGGRIAIVTEVGTAVHRLFELAEVLGTIPAFPREEEALDALASTLKRES